ncbi:hypothetical protein [uncultured Phycicoccus sp.]|uniref:hypothetical protein n=1 Tax=uncultured Phycicoccus sp. TaxID=661422 RepID=UPI002634AE10|nr:hypothetical protein [uncultured Phycicoccus sp.]
MFHMVDLVPVSGLDSEPAAAARFDAWAEVQGVAARHDLGDDHDAWTVDELRGIMQDSTKHRSTVLAVHGHEVLGAGAVIAPLLDNQGVASLVVTTRPDRRRAGVGGALLAWAEGHARELGRTTVVAQTQWAGGDVEDPHGPWARRRGFEPAQTVVRSDLAVDPSVPPRPPVAVPGYALETHCDAQPETDLEDRALLLRRISTDAPLGDLELAEEEWDADRVRADDAKVAAMGRRVVATYARHLESGRLVGYTVVQVPRAAPALAYQQDTLVLREHRGHGLGLALKLANHCALAEEVPAVRTVRTWNAVENTHMLAVNTALGFRPSGYTREWQKHLH